jgi:NAD(P)-dependent dehydrogenase (short-subunit alcohol dehydrogenase family)
VVLRGIHINAVCPATIEAPMVADMLASENSRSPTPSRTSRSAASNAAKRSPPAVLWQDSPGASFALGVAPPLDGGYTAR